MVLGLLDISPFADTVLVLLAALYFSWTIFRAFSTAYLSPLSNFPGPKAAALTRYWHACVECVLNRSFYDVLIDLHQKHGDVVRIGPQELHFANPQAYHDIYNTANRWDKERRLYHSFGEDRSSFGFLTYNEAKPRKDLLTRRFSSKAVLDAHVLIQDKIDGLCRAFERRATAGEATHVDHAFRCLTIDVITYLCFGKSVNAIEERDFHAPFLMALDASKPVLRRFKHSDWYKHMIQKCPPDLAKILSPKSVGLVNLQQMLGAQIKGISKNPQRELDLLPHNLTIYHTLIMPNDGKSGEPISAGSLYEEAQALMFAGSDTVGNALHVISYHLGKDSVRQQRLKAELDDAWRAASNQLPSPSVLEQLPYLNATLQEGLRISNGVVSGLLRHVPTEGATIAGVYVPGGTVVSCASPFVHLNKGIFPEPHLFNPERWLDNPNLERWLVPFSKGPRMCLGINLAWLELRMTVSTVFHRFDVTTDSSSPDKLEFNDAFLPDWRGVTKAHFIPVAA